MLLNKDKSLEFWIW